MKLVGTRAKVVFELEEVDFVIEATLVGASVDLRVDSYDAINADLRQTFKTLAIHGRVVLCNIEQKEGKNDEQSTELLPAVGTTEGQGNPS